MTPRRRAILIVGMLLILIAIIVAAVIFLTRTLKPPTAEAPPDVAEPATEVTTVAPEDTFDNPLIVRDETVPGKTASQQMAELFAERYGSYSNQGDYQNLRDLLPVMTDRYRRETEAFLATAEAAPGQPYEGVTSVKISTDVRSMEEDAAVIAVTLQQSKATGASAPTIGYRTLRMELALVGTDWRVDAAAWEN
ncbi:MAG TPA: hypothetical protein VL283_03455 [Candidatus Baltobacteraceae bacterium]|jgi:hypothetical protein|nr:hypothetical protein [Candidatus Baltobacteraceae bacterium]